MNASKTLNKTQYAEFAFGLLTFCLFLFDWSIESVGWVPAMMALAFFLLAPALLHLLGTMWHVLYGSRGGFVLMLIFGGLLCLRQAIFFLNVQTPFATEHRFLIANCGILPFLTIMLGIINSLTNFGED